MVMPLGKGGTTVSSAARQMKDGAASAAACFSSDQSATAAADGFGPSSFSSEPGWAPSPMVTTGYIRPATMGLASSVSAASTGA